MSQQTSQSTVNNHGQDTVGNSQTNATGTRTATSNRSASSESTRDLTNESIGASREIRRGNVAMQVSFTIPITSKIPVASATSC